MDSRWLLALCLYPLWPFVLAPFVVAVDVIIRGVKWLIHWEDKEADRG